MSDPVFRSGGATAAAATQPLPFAEFIALMALLMALPALSIDIMLVALPNISGDFALSVDNDRQLMITMYMLGFAAGQLFYGPLSDRYGRKPVLFFGLGFFILASLLAISVTQYHWMLCARALQGLAAAAPRVLAIAIVRDCSVGRDMSRIMSFIMMTFIIVPIFAPSIGSIILQRVDWPAIFWFLALIALICILWVALRLPETRATKDRASLSPRALLHTFEQVARTRQTVGYSIAMGCIYGCIMTYVGSAQQIFVDVYQLGDGFALAFGAVAMVMAVSSLTNIALVRRTGMRGVSHSGLLAFTLIGLGYIALGFPSQPPLWTFYLYLALSFYSLSLCMPNFNALAMEPMGRMAGTGSALTGFYTTLSGTFLGWLFGQAFDGDVRPLAGAFITLGLMSLLAVLLTERGRLWRTPTQVTMPATRPRP